MSTPHSLCLELALSLSSIANLTAQVVGIGRALWQRVVKFSLLYGSIHCYTAAQVCCSTTGSSNGFGDASSLWPNCQMLCLIFEIDFINQAKVCLIVQKSGKAFGLSVRPINLILSLTTSTQAVLCILLSSYRGALRAPV